MTFSKILKVEFDQRHPDLELLFSQHVNTRNCGGLESQVLFAGAESAPFNENDEDRENGAHSSKKQK